MYYFKVDGFHLVTYNTFITYRKKSNIDEKLTAIFLNNLRLTFISLFEMVLLYLYEFGFALLTDLQVWERCYSTTRIPKKVCR